MVSSLKHLRFFPILLATFLLLPGSAWCEGGNGGGAGATGSGNSGSNGGYGGGNNGNGSSSVVTDENALANRFKKKPFIGVDKCKGLSCPMGMPACLDGETLVKISTDDECCARYRCEKTTEENINPLQPNCPQAPAVMRQCKNNAEPKVVTELTADSCTMTRYICPEDSFVGKPPVCPQAPAVMRQCKNGVQPKVVQRITNNGCTIPKYICPEDSTTVTQ